MICNVQMPSLCSSLAHCTSFSALLSAPSFAWQCLTPWLLICLAPGPTLILCVFSTCDHKGVSIGIDRSIDRYLARLYRQYRQFDSIDSYRQLSTVSTVRDHRVTGTQYRQLSTVIDSYRQYRQFDSSTVSTEYRQYRQLFDSIDSIDSQGSGAEGPRRTIPHHSQGGRERRYGCSLGTLSVSVISIENIARKRNEGTGGWEGDG